MSPIVFERFRKTEGGFKTKAAAQQAMRVVQSKVDKREDPFPDEILVRDFANQWLEHVEADARLRSTTLRGYSQLLRDHVVPAIGHVELRALKPAHVQAIFDAMKRNSLSPRTVSHARSTTSAMLQHAIDMGLLSINVARSTRPPTTSKVQQRIPTPAELQAFIDVARGTEWEIATLLSATTGMRR